jgi:hypothetical protein
MKAFRCKGCGTGFSTTENEAPPSPNWDDGHVCEMIEVESKLDEKNPFYDIKLSEEELEARMDVIGQNGNTGEHYE